MDNKKLVMYVFSILILFGLILNFVQGTEHLATTSSVAVSGDIYSVTNWTKGGVNATVNFTLDFEVDSGVNITNITITIPDNVIVAGLAQNASGGAKAEIDLTSNADWECYNTTVADDVNGNESMWTPFLECVNVTGSGAINSSTTVNIWFNYTGNSSTVANSGEEPVIWNITTESDYGQYNNTEFSTNVDYLAPRLDQLNISDGYSVLINSSVNHWGLLPYAILNNYITTLENGTLRGDGTLTVIATFSDGGSNAEALESIFLYYLTNETEINNTNPMYEDNSGVNVVKMTTTDTSTPYKFTGDITGLVENQTLTFLLIANDSFDNKRYVNYTDWDASEQFAVITNSTNVPSLSLVNISQSEGTTNTITTTTGGYLRYGTHTIVVAGSGRDLTGNYNVTTRNDGEDGLTLKFFYNTTGNLSVNENGNVKNYEYIVNLTNYTNLAVLEHPSSIDFKGEIFIASGNDTNVIYWAVIANSTNATYFTSMTGEYTIDDEGPQVTSITITSSDTDGTISVGDSITLTCTAATDTGKGTDANGYVWTVKRGGEEETTITDQVDNTLTLSSTSTPTTSNAGTYTIKCTPKDQLGNLGQIASIDISVLVGTTGGVGGGVGGVTTTPTFDVDLSVASSGTIAGTVGKIKTFSFDGSTKHTLTFKEITATSATITIKSDPVDVTLMVGESKEVDVNSDGVNDLSVKLDKIKFGTTAEVTITKLEAGAKIVAEEEIRAAEEAAKAAVVKGTSWLWITLLIIVVVITIGYYVFKKK